MLTAVWLCYVDLNDSVIYGEDFVSKRTCLTRVVNTSLDDIVQGVAAGCLLVPQLAVDFFGQDLGHMVVVLGQVGELLVNFVVELEVVVGISERHDCFSYTARRHKQDENTSGETQNDPKPTQPNLTPAVEVI